MIEPDYWRPIEGRLRMEKQPPELSFHPYILSFTTPQIVNPIRDPAEGSAYL